MTGLDNYLCNFSHKFLNVMSALLNDLLTVEAVL